jgi:hypothetical protein
MDSLEGSKLDFSWAAAVIDEYFKVYIVLAEDNNMRVRGNMVEVLPFCAFVMVEYHYYALFSSPLSHVKGSNCLQSRQVQYWLTFLSPRSVV